MPLELLFLYFCSAKRSGERFHKFSWLSSSLNCLIFSQLLLESTLTKKEETSHQESLRVAYFSCWTTPKWFRLPLKETSKQALCSLMSCFLTASPAQCLRFQDVWGCFLLDRKVCMARSIHSISQCLLCTTSNKLYRAMLPSPKALHAERVLCSPDNQSLWCAFLLLYYFEIMCSLLFTYNY